MEFVFHISNCIVGCQVTYATCTLLGGAMTWWNSHVRTVGHDVAYGMRWKTLMKMMTENYCPRSEIKKLETELWNLTVKGTDVESYTQRLHELILLCSRMVPDELNKVEKYTGGLPDSIQGSVMASQLKMLQEAIELARILTAQKVLTYATRKAENKRRMDNNSRNSHAQQPPYKRSPTTANTQRASGAVQKTYTYFECGSQRHYKNDCPKQKNKKHRNTIGNVFDGEFGGVGDEEVVVGEGVVVTSSSLKMLTNSCLGGIMVSLIFLEGLEEEALEEFMVELFEEYDKMSKKYILFNYKA
nr:hypothetical protein [Tanacetum cinerariifolium]